MGSENQNLKGMNLLIVDDHPANLDVLFQTLEHEGYNISVAPDGEKALEAVANSTPDLILLDVMMPGIDGYEVCKRLKANAATVEIPIIFITAKNETEDIVKGFKLGGVDYITKPIRQEEVCARVRTHLSIKVLMNHLEDKNEELEGANARLAELDKTKTGLLNQVREQHSCLEQMNEVRMKLAQDLELQNLQLEDAGRGKDQLLEDLKAKNEQLNNLNRDLLQVNELNKKIMKNMEAGA